ncbi:MFS transporter [Pullulanibacillus camelliae]|uniref:MFS transporter n=1 Tax=Pullulanibacillus camelliae TaxID=1707096 RepID=A0A8J2VJT1_9BACL|nr:MFS transporter [Pullulanibacillus camelliae]GGE26546.1 MFS transporter [Pullulanibacillus camelliae]
MKKGTYIFMAVALFIAALNLRPAINSVSPILDSIRHDLGMSAATASLLTSIPVLCMGVFSPVAVKCAQRLGIERVIGWSLVIIIIGTVLRMFTHSSFFLLVTAFISGLGIAAIGPLLSGFIKQHFQSKGPLLISVFTVGLTIGACLASGLVAPLEDIVHTWQNALAIWAVLAVMGAIIWWLCVMPHAVPVPKVTEPQHVTKLPWNNGQAWLITVSFGLMAVIFYSVTAWLPPIVQSMGYNKVYAANTLTLFAFIQIPVSLLLPFVLRKFPSRLLWLLVASIFELIGFVMLTFSALPWLAAASIGIGAGALFSLNLLLPIDVTTHAQEAASWSAMVQAAGYVIGAAGPFILGMLHDFTGNYLVAIIGLILVNLVMMGVQIITVTRQQRKYSVTIS